MFIINALDFFSELIFCRCKTALTLSNQSSDVETNKTDEKTRPDKSGGAKRESAINTAGHKQDHGKHLVRKKERNHIGFCYLVVFKFTFFFYQFMIVKCVI